MTSLRFLTFTFWNSYVLKLLRLETLTFSDVTLSDINVVWCYVLSQYHKLIPDIRKEFRRGIDLIQGIHHCLHPLSGETNQLSLMKLSISQPSYSGMELESISDIYRTLWFPVWLWLIKVTLKILSSQKREWSRLVPFEPRCTRSLKGLLSCLKSQKTDFSV